jgi:hypothetical protein
MEGHSQLFGENRILVDKLSPLFKSPAAREDRDLSITELIP